MQTKANIADNWDEIYFKGRDVRQQLFYIAQEEKSARWIRTKKAILGHFGRIEGLDCIELGAGSAIASCVMAKHGGNVSVVDYSTGALDIAKKMSRALGIPVRRFIRADVTQLGRKMMGQYDICVSHGLAEHFRGENRYLVLKSHYDLIRPGGLAFVSVPYRYCIPFQLLQIGKKMTKRSANIECYPFSKSELMRYVKKLGTKCTFFGDFSIFRTFNPFYYYSIRHSKSHNFDYSWIPEYPLTPLDNITSYFISCKIMR